MIRYSERPKRAQRALSPILSSSRTNSFLPTSFSQTLVNRFKRTEVIELARTDINFFAALCLPHVMEYDFPDEYIAASALLQEALVSNENKDYNFVMGFPRGFAKTTWAKINTAWAFCFSDRAYALVSCSSDPKAQQFIGDVARILDSPNLSRLFGSYKESAERDSASLKIFEYRGKTRILQSVGAKGDPRGANIDFKRPDILICDDIQSRENARSEAEAANLYEWYSSTYYLAKSPRGMTHLYLGNTFPYEGCILNKLRRDQNYTSFIVGAILANGESLWPELHPRAKLDSDFRRLLAAGKIEVFLSELMNDDKSAVSLGFDYSAMPKWDKHDWDSPMAGCIMIDPAKNTKSSDDTAIGAALYYDDLTKPYFIDIEARRMSPLETIKCAMKMATRHNIQAIFVEDVAYQSTLAFWAKHICDTYGLHGFQFYPMPPRRTSKNVRITDSLRELQHGRIVLHEDVRPHVLNQISTFDPTKTDNKDDILDLLDYFLEIPQKFSREINLVLPDLMVSPMAHSSYSYPAHMNAAI